MNTKISAGKAGAPGKKRRRGSTMLEFVLLGIPVICVFTSVVTCSIDMWQFFTLQYAVQQTTRYTTLHGVGCTQNGNTCTILRSDVATFFRNQAMALTAAGTTLILNDGSGAITCNPVSSCPSASSQFPATGYNTVGTNITITAKYTLTNPIFMLWGGTVRNSTFLVGATSMQPVLF